jgi:hypothetical protein
LCTCGNSVIIASISGGTTQNTVTAGNLESPVSDEYIDPRAEGTTTKRKPVCRRRSRLIGKTVVRSAFKGFEMVVHDIGTVIIIISVKII